MGKYSNLWNRNKDGAYSRQRSFVRYAIGSTAFFAIFLCFITKDNALRWLDALIESRGQQRRIELLEQENRELDKRINMMSTNRDTLEKYARETFGFASPGDDVYVIE